MEPRCNEGSRDFQNVFAIARFRYIEVLFHIFYYNWGVKKIVRYTEDFVKVRYIEVPLYVLVTYATFEEYKSTMQNF